MEPSGRLAPPAADAFRALQGLGGGLLIPSATLILVEIMRELRDEGEPSDPTTPPAGPRLAP